MTDGNNEKSAAKILIVEDEAILAEDIELSLENLGYLVIGKASTGIAAFKLAEESKPDLILMDIKLQGDIDGIEAADRIRTFLDIPVIYLTGYSEKDVLERAKKTEPYGYLGKPVSLTELQTTIETALYKHKADKRVRKSEERLRLAMEATNDGVWDWQISTGETYYSPGYFLMLGLEPGECPKHFQSWIDLVHPEDREHAWNVNQDCILGKMETFEVQFRMRHKDGSWRCILGRGKSIARDPQGKSIRLVGTHTDITERKKAEERIRKNEERFRSLIDQASDAIFVHHFNGKFLDVNRRACTSLGYTRDELLSMSVSDVDPDMVLRQDISKFWPKLPATFEARHRRKDGTAFPVEIRLGPIEYGDTKVVLSIARDISERKKAEAELISSQERLQYLLSSSPCVTYTCKPYGDYGATFISDNVKILSGYEPSDFVEVSSFWVDHIHPEDAPRILTALPALFDRGYHVHEYRFLHKDGSYHWMRDEMNLVRDENGAPREIVGSWIDITDRKKAEDELRESERKYRDLFDGAPIGIFQSTIDGRILSINSAYAKMFGYTSAEEAAREIDQVSERLYVEPERRKMLIDIALRIDGFKEAEVPYRKKDGSTFWGLLHFRVVRDRDGDVKHLEGFIGDISERKKAEEAIRTAKSELEQMVEDRTKELVVMNEALRESQSTLRLITDSLPVLITYIDSDQRYRFCNKTYELWRGVPRKELEGKSMREILGEAAYERARPHVETALSGSLADYGMAATFEDGKERYLHVIYVPHLDETGATKGIVGLITDITERKRMEETLRSSRDWLERRVMERTAEFAAVNKELKREIVSRRDAEKELRHKTSLLTSLIESLPDAVYFKDTRRRLLLFNKAFEDFFGLSGQEVIGKTIEAFASSDKSRQSRETDESIIATKAPLVLEHSWVSLQGETFVFDTRKFPILDDDGNIIAIGGISRDITERKKSEEQIKASLREKEVLLREIHHRVKNNLAVIQSLLRIQSHHVKNEELSRILEETQHRIRSMALGHELLYQSQDLSRIRISKYLGNLLSQLIASFSIVGKRIEIRREIQEVQLGVDTAVPLGFILTELISNCYKHAFPGERQGQIAVSLKSLGDENLELVVRDDGVGLPERMEFEEPTSLGYLLIRIFVKQLNGEMQILGRRGTEVRIRFPS